jgi:opacity protein-like surface antigen
MRNARQAGSRLLWTFVGVVAASSCWAADQGFYFGVNIGRSDFDTGSTGRPMDVILVAQPVIGFVPVSGGGNPGDFLIPTAGTITPFLTASAGSSDVDDHDTTFSATVGYTFNRYLSLELSYADLGEATSSQTSTFNTFAGRGVVTMPVNLRVEQKLNAQTVALSVLGTLPLSERWTVFGRGGYGFSDSDVKVRASFSVPGATPSSARQNFNSDDFVVGAGVGFKFSQRWSLRADYERLFEAGAGSVDVDRIGLSAIYRL